MKTLLLFRHAKSSWDDPTLPDFDRPLADRGHVAAPPMATWLIENDCVPEVVFCSPARRAVETWEHLLAGFDRAIEVRLLHDLYAAEPERILDVVRKDAGDAGTVMVIGHNPGMEELARALAGDGRKKALNRMKRKFPTAAVAVIDFEVREWGELAAGQGRLRDFVRPKDLAG